MTTDDINNLRRQMESINKLAVSTSATVGKMVQENVQLKRELADTKAKSERALQMCNELQRRVTNAEPGCRPFS